MAEYIDRNALIDNLQNFAPDEYSASINNIIMGMPKADVVPVVHGRWENGDPICPVCGGNKFKDLDADIWCDWQPDFCPNCGAKMDECNEPEN